MVYYVCDLQGQLWNCCAFHQELMGDHPPLQRIGRLYSGSRLFITDDLQIYDTIRRSVINLNLLIVKLFNVEDEVDYLLLDDYNCLYRFNLPNMTTKLIAKNVQFIMKINDIFLVAINNKWNTLSFSGSITPIGLSVPISDSMSVRGNIVTVDNEYYLVTGGITIDAVKLSPPSNTIDITSYEVISFPLTRGKRRRRDYEVAALTDDGKLYIRYDEEFDIVNIEEIELYHETLSEWTSLIGQQYGVQLVNEDGEVYSIYYNYDDGDGILKDCIQPNLQYDSRMFDVDDCSSSIRSSGSYLSD